MTNPIGSCVWAKCPYCSMQFLNMSGDQIAAHTIECATRKQQEMHPEVLDLDLLVEDAKETKRLENGFDAVQLELGENNEG